MNSAKTLLVVAVLAAIGGGAYMAAKTPANLRNSGYLLRGWLSVQKIKQVKGRVIDGP